MKNNVPKEYISNITKASAYYLYKNGPIKDMIKEGKISEEESNEIKKYMESHLAYLYSVLLEENDIKKFDLIVTTMNKFYVNDNEPIVMNDDGFDNFYEGLFLKSSNITFEK